jgi:serralysin
MTAPLQRVAPALVSSLAAALVASAVAFAAPVSAAVDPGHPPTQPDGYGPEDPFDDAIKPDDGPQESVRHQAKVLRTDYGYRYLGAEQNTHLRLKVVDGKLRFRDTHVTSWKSVPRMCDRVKVDPGIAADCRIPDSTSSDDHTLIEVQPRLGNDYVDGRGLPATFDLALLGDGGRDRFFGGRGNDYLGGAMDSDRLSGGRGKDWIRGGDSRDWLWGGAQSDWLQGLAGRDVLRGGAGKDHEAQ